MMSNFHLLSLWVCAQSFEQDNTFLAGKSTNMKLHVQEKFHPIWSSLGPTTALPRLIITVAFAEMQIQEGDVYSYLPCTILHLAFITLVILKVHS